VREDVEREFAYPQTGRKEATKALVVRLLERQEAIGCTVNEVLDIRLVGYPGESAYWIVIQGFKSCLIFDNSIDDNLLLRGFSKLLKGKRMPWDLMDGLYDLRVILVEFEPYRHLEVSSQS
jgi:hypothetical protein